MRQDIGGVAAQAGVFGTVKPGINGDSHQIIIAESLGESDTAEFEEFDTQVD